jgi:hypothetical protein
MMAGFWNRAWEGLTGQGAKKQGQQAQKAAMATGADVARRAGQLGTGYDTGAQASMGANAGEYMQRANQAAQAQAAQAGQAAATQGSRSALQAARTAGVNPGQAALAGAQQAGDIYGRTYQGGLESGRQQYQQGTQQFAQQGAEMAGRQLQGAQLQGQQGKDIYEQGRAKGQATLKGIGNIAGAVGGMLSDERAKDIKGGGSLDAILAKIDPVRFSYKAEPGVERVGVTAQDVEASPLKAAVMETPAGKALDTDALAGSNLAMLVELGKRLSALEGRLRGKNGDA